jgi:hypothetical protein
VIQPRAKAALVAWLRFALHPAPSLARDWGRMGQFQECSRGNDANCSASQFFYCIQYAGIAIWNKYLQEFENDCAPKD